MRERDDRRARRRDGNFSRWTRVLPPGRRIGPAARAAWLAIPALSVLALPLAAVALLLASAAGGSPPSAQAAKAKDATAGAVPKRELVEERTRTSRTYLDERGRKFARIAPFSVNYRHRGDWKAIDSTLVRDGRGGHRNKANRYEAELPATAGEAVRFEDRGAWVSFALEGARGASQVAGARQRFAGALPHVSLVYTAMPDALKEELVLESPEAASRFSWRLRTSAGLRPRENRAGGIDLRDRDGDVRLSFAPPYMADSSQTARGFSDDVSLRLEGTDRLVLRADRDWLDDPKRKYPVTIDPTVTYPTNNSQRLGGTTQECTIASGTLADTNRCANATLDVGDDGSSKHRALLKFDVEGVVPRDATIDKATFGAHIESMTGVDDEIVRLHRVTRSWTTAATWNKHDGTNAWTTPGGDIASQASAEAWIAVGWYLWGGDGLKTLVQGWADRSLENHGLLLLEDQNLGGPTTYKLTPTRDTTSGFWPHLDVWYEHRTGAQRYYTFESQKLNDRMGLGVNVGNGNLLLQASDLNVRGTGLSLGLDRSYNHLPTSKDLDMGHGWRLGTGRHVFVEEKASGDVAFDGPSGYRVTFKKNADATYTAPTGLDAKLTKADGTFTLKFLKSEETLKFSSANVLKTHEDRNDNKITFNYDGADPTKLVSITDTQGRTVSVTRDAQGRIQKLTDPLGRSVQYGYDSYGQLTTYTDAAGQQTTYEYSPIGQLAYVTDPRGNATWIRYDDKGRVAYLTRLTDRASGAGPKWSFAYSSPTDPCNATDHKGKTTVTDPRGNQTIHCYDDKLRVQKTKDAESRTHDTAFTTNSNVQSYTTASGAKWEAAYDSSTNRLETLTAPSASGATTDAAKQTFSYAERADDSCKSAGSFRPCSSLDPQGNTLEYSYTTKGNLSQVKESTASSAQVKLEYNDGEGTEPNNGTVKSSTDGENHTTDYRYDAKGNLTEVDPPGTGLGKTLYRYDPISRPELITDGKGQQRKLTYDHLDRVTEIKFFAPGKNPDLDTADRTDTYAYDPNGNRTSRSDASGTTSDEYDRLNRLTKTTLPGARETLYTYDLSSNLASITHAGEQITYGYDKVNRVTSIKEPDVATPTSFAYTDDSQARTTKKTTTFPNGVVAVDDLDPAGRADKIKATKGTTVLSDFDYTYTKAGTTQERDVLAKVVDRVDNTTTTYDYDRLNRLTDATTTGSRSDTWRYRYDNASNRTHKAKNGSWTSYAYDVANRLCWAASGDLAEADRECTDSPTGRTTYDHDQNGNLTGSSTQMALTYNLADQTTSIVPAGGGTAVPFTYAGQGQKERTKKANIDYQNTALGLSSEQCGTRSDRFVRDDEGKLVMVRCEGRFYYLKDHLGSIVALTDANGNESRRHTYRDPFGEDVHSTAGTYNPWRFAGEYYDSETGLYKIGARYYAPTLGRWTQRDPINQMADPREANQYAYVGGDPVNLTDPTGLHGAWADGGIGPVSLGYSENHDNTGGSWGKGAEIGGLPVKLGGRFKAGVGASGGAYTGTAGDEESKGFKACALFCGGYDTDKDFVFGLGPEVGITFSF